MEHQPDDRAAGRARDRLGPRARTRALPADAEAGDRILIERRRRHTRRRRGGKTDGQMIWMRARNVITTWASSLHARVSLFLRERREWGKPARMGSGGGTWVLVTTCMCSETPTRPDVFPCGAPAPPKLHVIFIGRVAANPISPASCRCMHEAEHCPKELLISDADRHERPPWLHLRRLQRYLPSITLSQAVSAIQHIRTLIIPSLGRHTEPLRAAGA